MEALDNPGGSNDIAPPLDILRTDLISLFALVYSHATRASLAFKPPLTADAAAKSLSDMSGDLSRLVFCVQSFADNAHGRSMRKEVVWSAREVVENVESLVLSLFEMRQPRNANDKTYLLRTGSLHAAIDKSRQTLSVDNRAAVNRAWKTNNETLKDALKENRELIDEASAENEPEEDFDDGWGEVIESTAKMSETELGRSKKVDCQFDASSPTPPNTFPK